MYCASPGSTMLLPTLTMFGPISSSPPNNGNGPNWVSDANSSVNTVLGPGATSRLQTEPRIGSVVQVQAIGLMPLPLRSVQLAFVSGSSPRSSLEPASGAIKVVSPVVVSTMWSPAVPGPGPTIRRPSGCEHRYWPLKDPAAGNGSVATPVAMSTVTSPRLRSHEYRMPWCIVRPCSAAIPVGPIVVNVPVEVSISTRLSMDVTLPGTVLTMPQNIVPPALASPRISGAFDHTIVAPPVLGLMVIRS